jgi:hypothetical protein
VALDKKLEEMEAERKKSGIEFKHNVKLNGKWDFPTPQYPIPPLDDEK